MDAFGRILTAMITPMKENGEVDFDSAAKLACHLVETGSEGIVVSGTTGESPVLSSEEKCQLLKVVREAVSGKASVIAGTGSNDTAATIELTKEAEKVGCDGIMLVTPYYNKRDKGGQGNSPALIPSTKVWTGGASGSYLKRKMISGILSESFMISGQFNPVTCRI